MIEIPIPTENAVCLVLEYVDGAVLKSISLISTGGELFDYVATRGRISEEVLKNSPKLRTQKAAEFFRQIVSAIEYCHFHMVIHRGTLFLVRFNNFRPKVGKYSC